MKNGIRRLRGLVSMVRLVRDPSRLSEVFELADSMVSPELVQQVEDAVAADPRGALALAERPRIGRIDLDALGRLPEGSLGRAYAEHMKRNGLDPAAIPTREAHDAPSFVIAHLYESHDVWHAVTGFGTDVAGELGLQAFGLAQFPSRLAAVLIAGGLLHAALSDFDDRDARMGEIVRGWLMGKRAQKLFGVRWAEMWERPIEDVRRELGVRIEMPELEGSAPGVSAPLLGYAA
jgi:ubiquinone biosynthesis protein Coq4